MSIIVLQVFVGLCLAGSALLLFAYSVKQGDSQQADRLSLLPMEADKGVAQQVNSGTATQDVTQETRVSETLS